MRNMSRTYGKRIVWAAGTRRADRPFWAPLTLYFDRRAFWPLHFHSMSRMSPLPFPFGRQTDECGQCRIDKRRPQRLHFQLDGQSKGIPWNGGIGGMTTLKYFWNRARNWKITLRIRRTEGELVHPDLILEISPKVGVFDCSFFQFCRDI